VGLIWRPWLPRDQGFTSPLLSSVGQFPFFTNFGTATSQDIQMTVSRFQALETITINSPLMTAQ
jgi:hypothetical protein